MSPKTPVRWGPVYSLYQVTLRANRQHTYLPLLANYSGPDLVVASLSLRENEVQVVLRNRGNRPVVDEFWVDLYIDPSAAPTTVNQIWPGLGEYGAVWGIGAEALLLLPGRTLTLSLRSQTP